QKAVVSSGQWILYRHHPDRKEKGLNPLQLDSRTSGFSLEKYLYMENRFKMLTKSKPEVAKQMLAMAEKRVKERRAHYEHLASQTFTKESE
ncbi:MAG: pyruvate-ferredoxin/flavodoxin oxidoreductase, partial [bacterium]